VVSPAEQQKQSISNANAKKSPDGMLINENKKLAPLSSAIGMME